MIKRSSLLSVLLFALIFLGGAFVPSSVIAQSPAAVLRTRVDRINTIYTAQPPFEQDEQLTRNLIGLCNQVIDDPLFPALSASERGEIYHRLGWAMKEYNDRWFLGKHKSLSPFGMQTYFTQLRVAAVRFNQALEVDTPGGRVSKQRLRSVNALFEVSQRMTYQGIVFETEKQVAELGLQMKREAVKYLDIALSYDPLSEQNPMQYLGNGFFLYYEEERERVLYPLAGLMRYTNDLPADTSNEDAVKIAAGVHYSIATEVVPWANSLGARATPREKSFLQEMVNVDVLRLSNGVYSPAKATSLVITLPDPDVWTHEIAHLVRHQHAAYLDLTRAAFASMTPQDQELFRKMMSLQNPKIPEPQLMEEFYAYSHQLSDWKVAARKALRRKSNHHSDNTRRWRAACVLFLPQK